MNDSLSQPETPRSDKAACQPVGLRSSRNREQWLSIAKFLQAQKPAPTFKRKPTALDKARALVASFSRPESKA